MEEVYRRKIDWRTAEFRERSTDLADGLNALENNKISEEQLAEFYKDYPELDPRKSSEDEPVIDLKHGRLVLTSRMVAGNAMFRMQNMTTDSEEYEASVEAYLAGKPDPMELKLIAEAEEIAVKHKESKASKLLSETVDKTVFLPIL